MYISISTFTFACTSVGVVLAGSHPPSEFHYVNSFKGPIGIPFHLGDEKTSRLAWSGHSASLKELGRTRGAGVSY